MSHQILHVFRNTPFGREVFFQSLYFANKTGTSPKVYIPTSQQFLMYFKSTVVTVNLDNAFLRSPETAMEHAESMLRNYGLKPDFLIPQSFTSGRIPVLPVDSTFMCCPRSISDLSTKIGLGYIGPKVRSIIKISTFPLLIPSPVYKEWKSISVFFGGSNTAVKAVKLGMHISKTSGLPLHIFTQGENHPQAYYQEILEKNKLFEPIKKHAAKWCFFDKGKFKENLYDVPHDSLLVVGTLGHSLVQEVLFGSKAEILQTILPNNLLLVGPNYVSQF
jgi:nucleotide-binding universal stress UspA family protein